MVGGGMSFTLFFPIIAGAAMVSGPVAGLICLIACAGGGAFFLTPAARFPQTMRGWIMTGAFLASGGVLLWLTNSLKSAMLELSRSQAQERLLVGELRHRVKNTLAVVQSIAAQTVRASRGMEIGAPMDIFTERLMALSEAHDLLGDTRWGPVPMRVLVERTLRPFAGTALERVRIDGATLMAPADQVVGLSLCLHELATNSIKHGALSTAKGRVDVAWRLEAQSPTRVRLEWRERDGPLVTAPSRRGFGSRLLRQGLAPQARPQVRLDFPADGVVWVAEFDLQPA
jgi:two-component sensor histidine kinase